MNNLLQIKLPFLREKNINTPGPRNLRSQSTLSIDNVDKLISNLNSLIIYYKSIPKFIDNYLIDINYNDLIAKSNRVSELLKPKGKNINDFVVGARFSNSAEGDEKHIITYYIDELTVIETINNLKKIREFISSKLNGCANSNNFNKPNCILDYKGFNLSETKIRNLIVDCSVIESISVPNITLSERKENILITTYKTEQTLQGILSKLSVDNIKYKYSFYGSDTISVDWNLYKLLEDKVPYLISMVSSDLSKLKIEDLHLKKYKDNIIIPQPTNEPTIGVIDTLLDTNVYFKDWIENIDYLDEFEPITNETERIHGTEVSSIIVDGPQLNPWLNDNCGRFKVRHFGVCINRISTTRLVRKIKEIVSKNTDIHVWNLSLGIDEEVSKNFISFDAAAIDELQSQYNIIFVISGTNDNRDIKNGTLRIGAPADSLNSIVVNSVKRNKKPVSYSRKGPVLSFFNKPDVAYYGGDCNERIIAYSPNGKEEVFGTSFAAPWISRKLCFLIDIMGLSREIAKALIIDSAAGWEYKYSTYKISDIIGYGIVPIDIKDIINSPNDEIRFIIHDNSQTYKTSNYSIPVPKDKDNKYPYIARATLCYFPECSRAQGVDYTNRELSIKFGRVNNKKNIEDINDNIQDELGSFMNERKSRKEFRKWDNTKFISKVLKKNIALKSYDDQLWGFSITSKERLTNNLKKHLPFGAVITLKEIKGNNRIQTFIKLCTLKGFIVNELNIENIINLYNMNQEEIIFDE